MNLLEATEQSSTLFINMKNKPLFFDPVIRSYTHFQTLSLLKSKSSVLLKHIENIDA